MPAAPTQGGISLPAFWTEPVAYHGKKHPPEIVTDAIFEAIARLGEALAQRAPVMLFRSSSISVAFAATIACYVLYGPALAIWVNLMSAVVNSFMPKGLYARSLLIERLLKSMRKHPQYTPADSLALCRGFAPFAIYRIVFGIVLLVLIARGAI